MSSPVADPEAWAPPPSFDHFVVERPLGRGGMGHVYLGRDTALDRPVALKFIAAADPGPVARGRFLSEARALARLAHPNVVHVFRIGDVGDRPYLAYEFVAGQSLDRLARPLDWPVVLRILIGMARGLEAAHGAGILHRDIKPANVILSDTGEVKLLDFGVARLDVSAGEEVGPPALPAATRDVTRTSAVVGTPAYLAPEQWRGERASVRSDLYGLGLVAYELLSGTLPYQGIPRERLGAAILHQELTPVRALRPDVPESLAAAVDRCVRRAAVERFASAAELREELDGMRMVFLPSTERLELAPLEGDALAVANSFARITADSDVLTAKLYQRLFAAHPELRRLFPDSLDKLRIKLLHTLRLAIQSLRAPDHLVPLLEDLGRRHRGYGVFPEQLELLGQALLGSVEELDRAAWTSDLETAWRRAYTFIASAMRRGMTAPESTLDDRIPSPARSTPDPEVAPRTRYARNDRVSLAYQVFGAGPVDLVYLPGWLTHVEMAWKHPLVAGFLRGLGSFARVITFDKRGTGLSDRDVQAMSLDERVDDLRAVLDAAGVGAPVLFGVAEGAAVSAVFAATHPARVRGLVLYAGMARVLVAPDYPHGMEPARLELGLRRIEHHWGEPVFIDVDAPSLQHDPEFREWLATYMRSAASLNGAAAMARASVALDIRAQVPSIAAPTLVLHRAGDQMVLRECGRDLAARIPGARFVELAGADHLPYAGDTAPLLAEVRGFVQGLLATV